MINYTFVTPYIHTPQDRLWEEFLEWMDCLRMEPTENLLQIPSGVVQEHWPSSLKEFIVTSRSLVFPREQAELQMAFPGLLVTPLNNVLTQGMNVKKKHEVEVLAAVVNSIAKTMGAHKIIDIGAGQGYLAQVLSFHYQLPVVAIDACSHHGSVTNARAQRIKKYYASVMRKSQSGDSILNAPRTITCHLSSEDTLRSLSDSVLCKDHFEKSNLSLDEPSHERREEGRLPSPYNADKESPLVLAGLHACGDLSVTMLRTFRECEEVKAIVSVGCCYNLLSEEGISANSQCGFPISNGGRAVGLSLGKSARDLACQSAERWRCLGTDAGLHNFDLHAFRAAFQMVLDRFYTNILTRSPPIGRQGKALRRQQHRKLSMSSLHQEETTHTPFSPTRKHSKKEKSGSSMMSTEFGTDEMSDLALEKGATCKGSIDKYSLFKKFSLSAFSRLGLKPLQDIDLLVLWEEQEPFASYIGPYWSLRAALGPLVETLLLLDRLLFLQEQGSSVETDMLPIFNPALSPRNVALIAKKSLRQSLVI